MDRTPDFSYQKEAVKRTWELLHDPSGKPVVLAAVVGSGKSYMAKDLVGKYLEQYGGNVVFLAHCQTVLSEQFKQILKENADYSYSDLGGEERVRVGLPTYFNNNEVDSIDFLIVDEAHEYYGADMVQSIILEYKPSFVLLLTGTPGKYNRDGRFLKCYVSGDEMIKRDVYSPVDIDMVSVSSDSTSDKLFLMLDKAEEKLRRRPGKIMIVCKSAGQAKEARSYMRAAGYDVALSTNEDDPGSSEIERFKSEASCDCLIVVRRGILGFNCPEIECMLDMKESHNIDVVFQALARVFRKSDSISEKLYLRSTKPRDWNRTLSVLHRVVGLLDENNFKFYEPEESDTVSCA